VLEWKPRLIASLVVLVLVAAALVAGYFDFDLIANNWEW
jgi:hypothetical protein